MMRLALLAALAFGGCVNAPDRFTVLAPDHTPLAQIDLKRGNVILTPQGFLLLQTGLRRPR